MFPSLRTAALCTVLFAACALLTYGGSLRNGFVSLDDPYLILENPAITRMSPQTVRHVFTSYDPELYVPLTFVSYQIDYLIGGLDPLVYHAQNLLWHTANALLIALILWMLFGNGPVAIILGLLWLLHPLNVEAVAWAAARKDVLSGFFFLSSIVAYLRYRGRDSGKAYWVSVALFVAGLLAKVSIIGLPVVLLLLDWREGRPFTRDTVREKIPFLLAAVFFGVIALFGKTNALVVTTLGQKVLMAFASFWFAILSIVAPVHLTPVYPYAGAIALSARPFAMALLATVALGILLVVSLRRTREVAVGLGMFLLLLAPSFINFAKGNEIYLGSDRYTYLPMIGLLVIVAWICTMAIRKEPYLKPILGIASLIVVIAFGLLSRTQAETWKNSETLYSHAVEVRPDALLAKNNLGMEYLRQGKLDDALGQFNAVLAVREWPATLVNRGLVSVRRGDTVAAVRDFTRAMEIEERIYEAPYELGNVAYREGRMSDAIAWYKKSLEVNPEYRNTLNNLGAAYLQIEELDKAADAFRRIIALYPLFAPAYYNLAVIAEESGRISEAAEMYGMALSLNPDDRDAEAGLARVRRSP